MKLKINRKSLAILALTSATIFSGCTGKQNNNSKEEKAVKHDTKKEEKKISEHTHLTIDFGNQQLIFRECEDDIDIIVSENKFNSNVSYDIYDENDNLILEGRTGNHNVFYINNNIEEENAREIEKILIKKGAKVHQLKSNK